LETKYARAAKHDPGKRRRKKKTSLCTGGPQRFLTVHTLDQMTGKPPVLTAKTWKAKRGLKKGTKRRTKFRKYFKRGDRETGRDTKFRLTFW